MCVGTGQHRCTLLCIWEKGNKSSCMPYLCPRLHNAFLCCSYADNVVDYLVSTRVRITKCHMKGYKWPMTMKSCILKSHFNESSSMRKCCIPFFSCQRMRRESWHVQREEPLERCYPVLVQQGGGLSFKFESELQTEPRSDALLRCRVSSMLTLLPWWLCCLRSMPTVVYYLSARDPRDLNWYTLARGVSLFIEKSNTAPLKNRRLPWKQMFSVFCLCAQLVWYGSNWLAVLWLTAPNRSTSTSMSATTVHRKRRTAIFHFECFVLYATFIMFVV